MRSPQNKPSTNIIFLAFHACPEHEPYYRVNHLADESKLVTLGETEEFSDSEADVHYETMDIETSITDKFGRQYFKCSQSRPVITYIRNNIFHSSTCLEHACE